MKNIYKKQGFYMSSAIILFNLISCKQPVATEREVDSMVIEPISHHQLMRHEMAVDLLQQVRSLASKAQLDLQKEDLSSYDVTQLLALLEQIKIHADSLSDIEKTRWNNSRVQE